MNNSEQVIRFADLETHVRATKSKASVRNYLAVLKYLKAYFKKGAIYLEEINPGMVASFEQSLVTQGVLASSVRNYMTIFRALFKHCYGAERKYDFKRAFSGVGSKPVKTEHRLTTEDIKRITNADFKTKPALLGIARLFLLGYFNGGLNLEQLNQLIASDENGNNLYLRYFRSYISPDLISETIAAGLKDVAKRCGVKSELTLDNAAELWVQNARNAGISDDVIEQVNVWKANTAQSLPATVADAFLRVGRSVLDVKPRWFALRCKKRGIQDIEHRLREDYRGLAGTPVDTFIPPEAKPIEGLMFIKTDIGTASRIQKDLYGQVWIFSQAGTRIPLPISDSEMRLFMFLCDQSRQTISYHFGDSAMAATALTPGQTAQIIYGNFQGHVGIIERTPGNSFKVIMRLNALSGTVTATIPAEFLRVL